MAGKTYPGIEPGKTYSAVVEVGALVLARVETFAGRFVTPVNEINTVGLVAAIKAVG